jgi:endonuclease G
VPTHFAKVVLASKPSSPKTPDVPEISTGAFVLPNAPIPDDTPLESFVMPGGVIFAKLASISSLIRSFSFLLSVEAVERAAGLTLFSDQVKAASKHICKTTQCQVVVRRFDDAQKRPDMRKSITGPR